MATFVRTWWLLALPCALLWAFAPKARAATLDPAIAHRAVTEPDSTTTAIVWLEGASLELEPGLTSSRANRHRFVVRSLQSTLEAHRRPIDVVLSALAAEGVVVGVRPLWIATALEITGPAWIFATLERHALAVSITAAPRAEPITPSSASPTAARRLPLPPGITAIGAADVWHELGITGSGRLLGVLDSGVDGTHPALAPGWRGNSAGIDASWVDLVSGAPAPMDPTGHGTRVLGIATGLDAARGDTTGVAWGASWIAAAALAQPTGSDFDGDVLAALQWMCDPDGDADTVDDAPDVVVCSFGVAPALPGSPAYAPCDMRFQRAIDHLEAAGTLVVWSAGNSGPDSRTIASPADHPRNLCVGAIDVVHVPYPYAVPPFSARGPSDCDGVAIKPDLVAPGVSVRTTFPGDTVGHFSGTSAAAPHVAGVALLMREADPELRVTTMKELLRQAVVDLDSPGPDHVTGRGLVDARLAVDLVRAALVAINHPTPAPRRMLGRAHPNPFRAQVRLNLVLELPAQLVLDVFDARGRRVRRADLGRRSGGAQSLVWDRRDDNGRRVPGGVYFARLGAVPEATWRLVVIE